MYPDGCPERYSLSQWQSKIKTFWFFDCSAYNCLEQTKGLTTEPNNKGLELSHQ